MTGKPTPLSEPITIAEWWKNRRGESVRLVLNEYQGRAVFDLRTWYTADGKLKPGKGFAAEVRHLPHLAVEVAKAEARARALGREPGQFLAVYRENRRDVIETSFEADAVAVAIRDFVIAGPPEGWSGTPTALLAELTARASDGVRKSKLWPLSAQGLGNRIDRVAPLLRNKGFTVERRHSGQRFIIITPPAAATSAEAW